MKNTIIGNKLTMDAKSYKVQNKVMKKAIKEAPLKKKAAFYAFSALMTLGSSCTGNKIQKEINPRTAEEWIGCMTVAMAQGTLWGLLIRLVALKAFTDVDATGMIVAKKGAK